MSIERFIKESVESFESNVCNMIDIPSIVNCICGEFEAHLRKLCNSIDMVRKQDLNDILNKHFITGKEINRGKLLSDILNLLN